MRMSLQYYNLIVKYKPGKEMYIADCLSRHPLQEKLEENIVTNPVESIAISENRLEEYQRVSAEDQEIALLIQFVKQGFPNNKTSVPENIRNFWPYRDELHIVDDLLKKIDIYKLKMIKLKPK